MAFTKKKFHALEMRAQAKKIADQCHDLLLILQAHKDIENPQTCHEILNEIQAMSGWYGGLQDEINQIVSAVLHIQPQLNVWLTHNFIARIYDLYQLMRQHAGLGSEQIVRRAVQTIARDSNFIAHYRDLSKSQSGTLPFHVCLYNLRSAHNAGSILRLVDCMGLKGMYLAGYSPGPEVAGFRAASMGCEDWLSIQRITASAQSLCDSVAQNTSLIALELSEDSHSLPEFKWPDMGGVLVLGNEELGLPTEVLDVCDTKIAIPMFGRKASLNVSTACAIALYDLRTKNGKL